MSFYRRPLPTPPCIAFSSEEGKEIFKEALTEGNMQIYFPLSEQFTTQAEPAYCGLSTLTLALNALSVDPGRTWKGVWRWYFEDMLDCCVPLDEIKRTGISIGQFVCLANCNALKTQVKFASDVTVEDFRSVVRRICAQADSVLVVSYGRRGLGQSGDGHFSPIGGYNASRDMVLILDVARFKYPPHWVPLTTLFDAMLLPDPVTKRSRGYVELRKDSAPSLLLFRVVSTGKWRQVFLQLYHTISVLWALPQPSDSNEPPSDRFRAAMRSVLECVHQHHPQLLDTVTAHQSLDKLQPDHRKAIEKMIRDLESTKLYQLIVEICPTSAELHVDGVILDSDEKIDTNLSIAHVMTVFLLALPEKVKNGLQTSAETPTPSLALFSLEKTGVEIGPLHDEIVRLQSILEELESFCCIRTSVLGQSSCVAGSCCGSSSLTAASTVH